jgi:hypothetical protein
MRTLMLSELPRVRVTKELPLVGELPVFPVRPIVVFVRLHVLDHGILPVYPPPFPVLDRMDTFIVPSSTRRYTVSERREMVPLAVPLLILPRRVSLPWEDFPITERSMRIGSCSRDVASESRSVPLSYARV